jgi:hypothetical protein
LNSATSFNARAQCLDERLLQVRSRHRLGYTRRQFWHAGSNQNPSFGITKISNFQIPTATPYPVVHTNVRESLKRVWGQCDACADRAEFDRALENPKRLPRLRKSAAKRQAADTATSNYDHTIKLSISDSLESIFDYASSNATWGRSKPLKYFPASSADMTYRS